jgi:hypothetical protein
VRRLLSIVEAFCLLVLVFCSLFPQNAEASSGRARWRIGGTTITREEVTQLEYFYCFEGYWWTDSEGFHYHLIILLQSVSFQDFFPFLGVFSEIVLRFVFLLSGARFFVVVPKYSVRILGWQKGSGSG